MQIFKAELKSWMLGEFASLKSKHDSGVASAKIKLSKTVQGGRSMIEMLGVLAIVGVLSVGGIAGYSKAMERYKINKTIEQITQITYNIFSAYANQKTMDDLYTETDLELMKSLGFIPENMEIKNDENGDKYLYNVFGGLTYISAGSYYCHDIHQKYHRCEKFISFDLYNISKEACLALGSYNWSNASKAMIGVGIASSGANVKTAPDECWFENYTTIQLEDWLVVCNNGISDDETDKVIPLPISPAIVAQHCNCKENTCYFGVSFTDR